MEDMGNGLYGLDVPKNVEEGRDQEQGLVTILCQKDQEKIVLVLEMTLKLVIVEQCHVQVSYALRYRVSKIKIPPF